MQVTATVPGGTPAELNTAELPLVTSVPAELEKSIARGCPDELAVEAVIVVAPPALIEEGAAEQLIVGGAGRGVMTTGTGVDALTAREEDPLKTAVIECVPWLSVEIESCA